VTRESLSRWGWGGLAALVAVLAALHIVLARGWMPDDPFSRPIPAVAAKSPAPGDAITVQGRVVGYAYDGRKRTLFLAPESGPRVTCHIPSATPDDDRRVDAAFGRSPVSVRGRVVDPAARPLVLNDCELLP
jgi:hypothetical protein